MRENTAAMTAHTLNGYALILGASSGFGEAAARAYARAGMDIIGVHLDRRSTLAHVEEIQQAVRAEGRQSWFYNVNAADEGKRRATLDDIAARITAAESTTKIKVVLHSLAFGTLRPLIAKAETPDNELTQMQIDMTLNVMANSLVYWVQDVMRRGLFAPHARVFAMTSSGAWAAWPEYGAVSAAKAALESYVRQLACEGAQRGFTANAICAGVTRTPALDKIPGHEALIAKAEARNPWGRLTRTEDVANALLALSEESTYWINGNVINVDGGEAAAG